MVYKLYPILLQLNQPSVEATAHFSLNLSAIGMRQRGIIGDIQQSLKKIKGNDHGSINKSSNTSGAKCHSKQNEPKQNGRSKPSGYGRPREYFW